MPSERENSAQILTPVNYDVAGNVFRAYFDSHRKLVFVIDYTISARKPNVMLVINAVGNRKWDDVLTNDYGIDLETVRPKKDNKYQKLDIEYNGLAVYGDLIEKFESGDDVGAAIDALNEFRIASARRAASERLTAANVTAENARETIAKTNETLDELGARVKSLRSKLSRQRKEIGREPTKQSAAKILRTEAQIDATNEKTRRAKKRLASAQRRLIAAEEDAEIARGILSMDAALPAAATAPALSGPDAFPNRPDTAIAAHRDALPAEITPQFTEIVPFDADAENENIKSTDETKAEIMADEEVKPLFDKDPEILDEEIAFKPIDFDVPGVATAPAAPRASDEYSDGGVVSPLSFVPPTATQTPAHAETAPINVTPVTENSAPVLDTITSVEMPDASETIITEAPITAPAPMTDNTAAAQPVAPAPMPEIAPAPMSSDFRPVSPITGGVTPTAPARRKPTLMYYIMLVLLIALSIFTLWIYQKSASDNVPDLTTTTAASVDKNAKSQPAAEQMPEIDENVSDSPFVDVTADVVEKVEVTPQTIQAAPIEPDIVVPVTPETVDVPATAPMPMPEPEAEPVPVTPDIEPVPAESEFVDVEVIPEPKSVPVETPFLSEPVPDPEPVVNKPAYNVSQQENMFVASPDYETDADEYMQTETFGYEDDGVTCSDGRAPDAFGCCSGEVFTDMGDGTAACCSGNECFPPMF